MSGASCSDEDAEDEVQDDLQDADCAAPLVVEGAGVRPGIVHRLDVGTTGGFTGMVNGHGQRAWSTCMVNMHGQRAWSTV